MKIMRYFLFAGALLVLASCGSSKKSADTATPAAPDEMSKIDEMVAALDANTSLTEKFADIKVGEKGKVSTFYDEKGNLSKIVKTTSSSAGEKTVKYFFNEGNLIHSMHSERNTLKEKGKTIFSVANYYFSGGKLISAKEKLIKLKAKDEGMMESKMMKQKFKAITPNANFYRDELAVIKKLKQLIK